jgi:tetratricopeptide (TPR) repeat protein
MTATRPWTGFGPDNFVADFPGFVSTELARAYPDFYHESPHNLWLDTLAGQGIPGLLAQIAMVALALFAGYRVRRAHPELFAGLIAALVAHQFVVFTVVNALYFYLGCALLIALPPRSQKYSSSPLKYRGWAFAGASLVAISFLVVAFRLVSTDLALTSADRLLARGNARLAADSYRRALDRPSSGVTADLYFSRLWAQAAADAPDTLSKLYFAQLALASASLATLAPEGNPNAWFNLAQVRASSGDTAAVETALRSSIAQAPNWFKPHWALARLLFLQSRKEEAREESIRAMSLNPKDQEVISTLAPILSFREGQARSPNP